MDLWDHCKQDQDLQARRKNREMKMLKWIERAEQMEGFKKFVDLAMKTMHKKPDGTGRERGEKIEGFNKFMDLVMEAVRKQPDETSRADCEAWSGKSSQRSNGTMEEDASHSSAPKSSDLKITVYKHGEAASVTRVPESTIKLAGKLTKLCSNLQAQDVNLDEVVRLMETNTFQGTILEHEHLKNDVKIVISVGDCSKESLGGSDQVSAPANLKIKTYKDGEAQAASVTTVSGGILYDAGNVIPSSAREAMRNHGVDFEEIVRFSMDPNAKGVTILDHEDLEKMERVVISLE